MLLHLLLPLHTFLLLPPLFCYALLRMFFFLQSSGKPPLSAAYSSHTAKKKKKKKLKKKFRRWKNSTHNAQQSQTYTSCPLPGTPLKSYPELFNPLASTIRVCCQCHVSLILSTLCSRNDIRSNNANYNLISEKFFLLEQH